MTKKRLFNSKRSLLLTSYSIFTLSMVYPLNVYATEEPIDTEDVTDEANEVEEANEVDENNEINETNDTEQNIKDNDKQDGDPEYIENGKDDQQADKPQNDPQRNSQHSPSDNFQQETDLDKTKQATENEAEQGEMEEAGATKEAPMQLFMTTSVGLPLSQGQSSVIVRNVKTNLLTLGYGDPDSKAWTQPDNFFGKQTEQAVKNFQEDYGLTITGIIDVETLEQLEYQANNTYSYGQSSERIKELKSQLLALGYGDANSKAWTQPDNFFGKQTEQVLKNFQEDHGLPVTGQLDRQTNEKIDRLLQFSYSVGQRHKEIRQLKLDLLQLGYGNPDSKHWTNPDDYFGPGTKIALEAFQLDYGLAVTGELDGRTADKIESVLNSSYTVGQRHENIRQLKKNLFLMGYGDPTSKHWTSPDDHFGPGTKTALEAFQRDFDLPITGVFNQVTGDKILQLLDSSYFMGQSHEDIRQLKKDLLLMGYGNPDSKDWTDPDNYFGPGTRTALKAFQTDFNLTASGILDQTTAERIDLYVNTSYFMGQSHEDIRLLKKDLLLMGYGNPNSKAWTHPDRYFGPGTKTALEAFQEDQHLLVTGALDTVTATRIDLVKRHKLVEYDLTFEEALDMQMRANPQTDKPYAYVSVDYISVDGKVTADVLNIRSGPSSKKAIINTLKEGDQVKILERVDDWYRIEYNSRAWVDAVREDVAFYLNPENFTNSKVQMFQFLDLSRPSDVSAAQLNNFLKGKGILEGTGQAFITASNIHGVNEVYLLSHALLETGHGSSRLARGVKVNGVVVYNMFGIGAVDSDPIGEGSKRAYEEGWTTPEKAIIGGARFIGRSYVNAGQNTLYKMRWNPYAMNSLGYATHQYATDIGWASKQVYTMYNLYEGIGINNPYYTIPVYKN